MGEFHIDYVERKKLDKNNIAFAKKSVWAFTEDVAESKPQWGTITRQSGRLLSKSLQAINAGEGVEKREPSYTVGGNAN